ncbi:MAG: hypothetical protein ACLFPS_02180 [Clostridia bacterium]
MSEKKHLQHIKYHLEKIEKLYVQLIKEMIDKISRLKNFNLSISLQFMIAQHVYLEQIASHLVAIDYYCKKIDVKYFNKHLLREIFDRADLITIDILVSQIIEKIGFIRGLEKKGKEILAKHKMKASWRTRTIDYSYKIMNRYHKKPIFHMFFK